MWKTYLLEAIAVIAVTTFWVVIVNKILRKDLACKEEDFLDWKDEDDITK